MLRPRIIPCLLIKNNGLVKTKKFKDPKYVGDPLNAVRIFNEKEVDELMVLDIDATRENRPPNENLIAELAAECRMPLCYGGGVKSVEQICRLISLGVEKIALSSVAVKNPSLIAEASKQVGKQSVVVVIDYKNTGIMRKPEVFIENAERRTGLNPVELAQQVEKFGAGEIVLNSIDNDGMLSGYDIPLIKQIRRLTSVPLTALGGAGSLEDIRELIALYPVIGAAAGSLFVFKGKYRAVLISYPTQAEREALVDSK